MRRKTSVLTIAETTRRRLAATIITKNGNDARHMMMPKYHRMLAMTWSVTRRRPSDAAKGRQVASVSHPCRQRVHFFKDTATTEMKSASFSGCVDQSSSEGEKLR